MDVQKRLLAVAATIVAVSAGAVPGAQAAERDDRRTVTQWAQHASRPLRTVDPAAPSNDLRHLRRSIGGAEIVGLGEATHGSAETTALKHRVLRLLVEELGFRIIAWEEDWSLGLRINHYLRTGEGDLAELVSGMSTAWRSAEITGVLRWIRAWNAGRADDVTFVGVEAYATRPLVYDLVETYLAERAPALLPEARSHLWPLTPRNDDMQAHVQWYWHSVTDKAPYVQHARELYELVSSVSRGPGDREHAVHLQHARQIVGFYEQFADVNPFAYRDAHAARNLRWAQEFHGDKVAYWAASGHTVDAPELRLTQARYPALEFASVGSFIRDWYAHRYRSIGFTLNRGSVMSEGQVVTMPPAASGWLEAPFAAVRFEQFTLDLREPAPAAVRQWLRALTRTRGMPEDGHESYLGGGTPAQWFDLIVHRRVVSPTT